MLIYDFDDAAICSDGDDEVEGNLTEWLSARLQGVGFVVYSTFNHGMRAEDGKPKWKAGHPRFRVVIFLSRDVDVQSGEYAKLWQWGYELFGKHPDKAGSDASRVMQTARQQPKHAGYQRQPFKFVVDGADLNPDALPDSRKLDDVVVAGGSAGALVKRKYRTAEIIRAEAVEVVETFLALVEGEKDAETLVDLALDPTLLQACKLLSNPADSEGVRQVVKVENVVRPTRQLTKWKQAVEAATLETPKVEPSYTTTLADIESMLEYLADNTVELDGDSFCPVEDHAYFVKVVQGVVRAIDVTDHAKAFELVDGWASLADNYDPAYVLAQWNNVDLREGGTTIATLATYAAQHGYQHRQTLTAVSGAADVSADKIILKDGSQKSFAQQLAKEWTYTHTNPDGSTESFPPVSDSGRVMRFNGELWEEINADTVRRHLVQNDYYCNVKVKDEEGNLVFVPATVQISDNLAHGTFNLLRASVECNEGYFADAHNAVQLGNAVVWYDEKSGKIEVVGGFHPRYRQRGKLKFDYDADAGEPEMLLKALRLSFKGDEDAEDKIRLIQQWVGAAVFGYLSHQKAILFCGKGGAGKSVIMDLLYHLFPAGATCSIEPKNFSGEFALTNLPDSRINIAADIAIDAFTGSDVFKKLVTGDAIEINRKNKDPVPYRPNCAQAFSANRLPAVASSDTGFQRRWFVVEFNRSMHDDPARIPNLDQRIAENELPAFFNWCVEGLESLLEAGAFVEPASSIRQRQTWAKQTNLVARWVSENVVECDEDSRFTYATDETRRVLRADAYKHFAEWAKAAGHRVRAQQTFEQELEELGFERKRNGVEGNNRSKPAWQFTLYSQLESDSYKVKQPDHPDRMETILDITTGKAAK